MEYYNITIKIAIVLSIVAIISNFLLCVCGGQDKYTKWETVFTDLAVQCRWLGILYFVFAWFVGNGLVLDNGYTTYQYVAHWLQLISIGWMVVFIVSLITKAWNKGDKKGKQAAWSAILLFVTSYLIH